MKFSFFIMAMGIMVILASFFLFSDLAYHKSYRTVCADDVLFRVTKQPLTPGEFCYDARGKMDFVIVNQGDLDLSGVILEIRNGDIVKNVTLNGKVVPLLGNSYSVNVLLEEYGGKIDQVSFYPKIIFEEEETVCLGNKFTFKNVEECAY